MSPGLKAAINAIRYEKLTILRSKKTGTLSFRVPAKLITDLNAAYLDAEQAEGEKKSQAPDYEAQAAIMIALMKLLIPLDKESQKRIILSLWEFFK